LYESNILQHILSGAKAKENALMSKKLTSKKNIKLLGIPKLEDANFAGGQKSKNAVLILTEGDSAKAMALAGLEVVGRDLYGIFPLRGKLLNVRDSKAKSVMENEEIKNIIKILGLKIGKKYDNVSELRYGSICIMAD